MNVELRNYLRRLTSPAAAAAAATSFAAQAIRAVNYRFLPWRRHAAQPARIKAARQAVLAEFATATAPAVAGPVPRRSLSLAVGRYEIASDSDWHRVFDDIEVTVSLHRWNWLLRGITDDDLRLSRDDALALMRSWIRSCIADERYALEAYTTGERVTNAVVFLLSTGDGAIPEDIQAALRVMARQVAEHLEYYPGDQTGNHAFNNARALLFAGLAAHMSAATALALAIAEDVLPKLVTVDGFLREGSSHYHFLFTRWVLGMLWMARRFGCADFERLLAPYAPRLVQRCRFFAVREDGGRWTFPLIGDVSPDVPPRWLIGVAGVATEHHGWHDLFADVVASTEKGKEDESGQFPDSGWFRADHAGWTVFARAASCTGSRVAGHAHHDLTGFALFDRGKPVLIDVGRLDYTSSPLGEYGRSALAHNVLLVDDLGPTAHGPEWMSPNYRAVNAEVTLTHRGGEAVLTIRHTGFRRLAGSPVSHERVLTLGPDRFRIEDRLGGSGSRLVRQRFHFAAGQRLERAPEQSAPGQAWRLGDQSRIFKSYQNLSASIVSNRADAPPGGLFFPEYGRREAIDTLDVSGRLTLPVHLSHELLRLNA